MYLRHLDKGLAGLPRGLRSKGCSVLLVHFEKNDRPHAADILLIARLLTYKFKARISGFGRVKLKFHLLSR